MQFLNLKIEKKSLVLIYYKIYIYLTIIFNSLTPNNMTDTPSKRKNNNKIPVLDKKPRIEYSKEDSDSNNPPKLLSEREIMEIMPFCNKHKGEGEPDWLPPTSQHVFSSEKEDLKHPLSPDTPPRLQSELSMMETMPFYNKHRREGEPEWLPPTSQRVLSEKEDLKHPLSPDTPPRLQSELSMMETMPFYNKHRREGEPEWLPSIGRT